MIIRISQKWNKSAVVSASILTAVPGIRSENHHSNGCNLGTTSLCRRQHTMAALRCKLEFAWTHKEIESYFPAQVATRLWAACPYQRQKSRIFSQAHDSGFWLTN